MIGLIVTLVVLFVILVKLIALWLTGGANPEWRRLEKQARERAMQAEARALRLAKNLRVVYAHPDSEFYTMWLAWVWMVNPEKRNELIKVGAIWIEDPDGPNENMQFVYTLKRFSTIPTGNFWMENPENTAKKILLGAIDANGTATPIN